MNITRRMALGLGALLPAGLATLGPRAVNAEFLPPTVPAGMLAGKSYVKSDGLGKQHPTNQTRHFTWRIRNSTISARNGELDADLIACKSIQPWAKAAIHRSRDDWRDAYIDELERTFIDDLKEFTDAPTAIRPSHSR